MLSYMYNINLIGIKCFCIRATVLTLQESHTQSYGEVSGQYFSLHFIFRLFYIKTQEADNRNTVQKRTIETQQSLSYKSFSTLLYIPQLKLTLPTFIGSHFFCPNWMASLICVRDLF